jgi:hypothetical protein
LASPDNDGCLYCVIRGNISWVLPKPEVGSVEVTICQTPVEVVPVTPCTEGTTYTLTYSEDSTEVIFEDIATGFVYQEGPLEAQAQVCILDAVYIAAP